MASAFWLLLAGAGIADGKASVLQTKSYSIKQNGNYAFTPDAGYDGFSSINVSVAVEAKLQEKSITPTKQEQTVTPDAGFEGLSKIVVGAIPASYIDTSSANATSPDILAPKTAFVNGELVTGTMQEYDGSVTNGTEGMKPQLNAPTIAVSGRQLTINNPSTNGNFTEGYKIFVDGVEKSEQTANTLDLYSYFDENGTYQLSVAAAAAQFADSNQSSQVTYQKETPTSGVVWLKNAEQLYSETANLAATTVGDYAIFAGGTGEASATAYDSNLTRVIVAGLSGQAIWVSATNVGSYAIFGGGYNYHRNKVDAYNQDLTKIVCDDFSTDRVYLAATNVGEYALFGGGESNISGYLSSVEVYDTQLVKSSAPDLSVAKYFLSATSIGDYGLFAGGQSGRYSPLKSVDAYDTALTKSTLPDLQDNRSVMAAAANSNYALFGGGNQNGSARSFVDAYNKDLTKSSCENLSQTRSHLAATSVSGYVIFAGGGTSAKVDAYDETLSHTIPLALSSPRSALAGASIGSYALFGGGETPVTNVRSDNVDVYTIKE